MAAYQALESGALEAFRGQEDLNLTHSTFAVVQKYNDRALRHILIEQFLFEVPANDYETCIMPLEHTLQGDMVELYVRTIVFLQDFEG